MDNKNHKIVAELIRFFGGSIGGTFFLFILRDLDMNVNEHQKLYEWIGVISVVGFFISYITGFIVLEREEIKKINYKDLRLYFYVVLILGIEYLLIPTIL